MRFCYCLWALSVTSGIIFYNFACLKGFNINFIYILFSAILFVMSLFTALLRWKKHLNPKNIKILFLFFSMLMLFIISIISANFNYERVNGFRNLASENNIFKYKDSDVYATGKITSSPYKKFSNSYFDFEIVKLEIFNKKTNKSAQFKDCGNILIEYKSDGINTLELNDFIYLNITGSRIFTNKDGNISEIFIASKIINAREEGFASYFFAFKSKIHSCLEFLFFKSLSSVNAKIAGALILGNQAQIPREITESFKKSGIYHILSISGLHITIIAAFIFQILGKILFSLKSKKIFITFFIIFFLIFYNLIVGEKASMLRASAMFILVFLSRNFFIDYRMSNVLLISYTVLLIVSPEFLTNIGFILSFASIAAIIYISPIIKNCLDYFLKNKKLTNNYFIKSMIAAFAVNIFILPILAYYFNGFSIISIFSNLAAAPVFYILLLDLFVSSIAAVFWFMAGSFFVIPANLLMDIIVKLSDFFASLPFGFINTDIFKNKIIIYLFYFSLIIIFSLINLFLKRKSGK
jgi:ComEC/Rec2-related protein